MPRLDDRFPTTGPQAAPNPAPSTPVSAIFPAEDLIQLPRFDAIGAVTLGDLLVHASGDRPLPRSILRAREALEAELAALRVAAHARLAAAGSNDPAEVAGADCRLDGCWTALFDWLTGFSKLPDEVPQALEARALLGDLYPDGLSFILLPYELEWRQSDLRLGRISQETLGDRIRALGGQVFLDAIAAAHEAYGRMLGLPRSSAGPESAGPPLHEALERFASALRVYALKVTAHVEVEEPETAVLAKALLDPLLTWKGSRSDGDAR
jgi:hypothetical protein